MDRRQSEGRHDRPIVSVVMANYNGAAHIAQAMRSVLEQSLTRLELIVSDDASSDESIAIVQSMMEHDPRLSLVTSPHNTGPGATRNRALACASGEWIAVVDADDLIHAERLERLLAIATRNDADIIADDLLYFHDDGSPPRFLLPLGEEKLLEPGVVEWIQAGRRGTPVLGYLKPMFRASALGAIAYDETLRVGEDFDLVLRLLLKGAQMLVVPEPWYLYRRHSRSTSHRLRAGEIRTMIESQNRVAASLGPFSGEIDAALQLRRAGLRAALRYAELVEAVKQRQFGRIAARLATRPALLLRLIGSFSERMLRLRPVTSPPTVPAAGPLSVGTLPLDLASSVPDVVVPAYEAVTRVPGGGLTRRETWRRLAHLAQAATTVLPEDLAGEYAAGFVANRDLVSTPRPHHSTSTAVSA